MLFPELMLKPENYHIDIICEIRPTEPEYITNWKCDCKREVAFTHFLSIDPQTDIAAVSHGRDFLSSTAHVLLDTLMKLLEQMKAGFFPKLKVYVKLWQNILEFIFSVDITFSTFISNLLMKYIDRFFKYKYKLNQSSDLTQQSMTACLIASNQ